MKSFSLATHVWFRAQGIFGILHVAGIVLGSIHLGFANGEADGIGFLLFIALFSCGFALAFGLPAWIALSCLAHMLVPITARARMTLPFLLIAGLGATAASLWLAFHVGLEDMGDLDGLDTLFSVLACASMLLSVLSLRKKIRIAEDELLEDDKLEKALDLMKR